MKHKPRTASETIALRPNLLYRQTAADMVTTINEGDQSFYGNYTLNATITMGAINKKKEADSKLEGCGFSPDEKRRSKVIPIKV